MFSGGETWFTGSSCSTTTTPLTSRTREERTGEESDEDRQRSKSIESYSRKGMKLFGVYFFEKYIPSK